MELHIIEGKSLKLELKHFMHPNPISISAEMPIIEALNVMKEGNFRHLPVTKEDMPYSIVTEKEIAMVIAFAEDDEKILLRPVSDFCALDLVNVDMNSNILEMLDTFIEKKIGAVVVVEENKFVGILSVIDVLKAFRQIMANDLLA